MVSVALHRVLPLPTESTVVFEAVNVTTEERTHHATTRVTRGILEVWIYLNAFREFAGLNLDVAGLYGFHVVLSGYECHATGPDGILMPVCVDPRVNNATEKIVHDRCKRLSGQQAV